MRPLFREGIGATTWGAEEIKDDSKAGEEFVDAQGKEESSEEKSKRERGPSIEDIINEEGIT